MKRISVWQVAALVVFVSAGVVAVAAIQGQATVCKLSMSYWQLAEKDGRAYLVDGPQVKSSRWSVSAPTIKDEKGRFLAGDPKGRNPTVHLVTEKGPHVQWAFEITGRLNPREVNVGGGERMKEGEAGFQFKLKLAGGPFEGWYLTDGEVSEEQDGKEIGWKMRPLKLVKDPKKAAVFTFIQTKYEVQHK